MKTIAPDAIAYKLAALRNFYTPEFQRQVETRPRLGELLWFLQWHSTRPGGIGVFVKTLLDSFPDRLGTPAMRRLGAKDYTAAESAAVAAEIPEKNGGDRPDAPSLNDRERMEAALHGPAPRAIPAPPAKYTRARFLEICRAAALHELPAQLQWFCSLPETPEILTHLHWNADTDRPIPGEDRPLREAWYFHDLPGALIQMLDIHAARESKRQAQTQIAVKTFDALNYALSQNAMVRIEGQTRYGKTFAAKTFCAMYPGRARYFTPSGGSAYDLLTAIGEAFGMLITPITDLRDLKSKIQFIIKHGRMMLIADEAHRLFPSSPRKLASPKRLEWARENIVDVDCPLALVTTPQNFRNGVKVVKETGHNIDQFLGRTILNVQLPAELDETDLRAVARFHFPDIDNDYLDLIMAKALRTEGFLMAIQGIAKRAAWLAQRDQRQKITLADIRTAADEFMPGVSAPVSTPAPNPAPSIRLQRTPPARSVATPRHTRPALAPLTLPARSITPALETQPA